MRKNLLHISLAAGLVIFSIVQPVQASINQMESKKQQIQEKRHSVQSGINQAEATLKSLQGKQQSVAEKIEIVSNLIKETTEKINEQTNQISQTKVEIAELRKEIEIVKERMAQREALLKERARAMQASGGNADYLEVLLGSKSFGNFLERVNAVAAIMDADQEILRQQEEDKKKLENDQKQLETKLADLEQMLQDLQVMKDQQRKQAVQLSQLMKQLQAQEKETHAHQMDLKEQEDLLSSQEASIKQAINLEKTRQAELAAARKRAAEEARQQAALAAKQASMQKASNKSESRAGSSTPSIQSYSAPAPAVSGGTFTRPAAGILSSNYGLRGSENHKGVDIASGGYVPIMAAADGIVSRAYASSSYGNVVFVSHSINGQVYTTVYAHMQSFAVSTGQVVAKGQQIGVMGNTGQSSGQHLHFELHKGPWNAAKSNAVNPIGIVF
ncbi:peptidoglycan hydrolase CwlO-like protein [Peribacillus deserti]|uniref:Peptidoglycan hydrolase CwlO-like protein n=1 Tax=Peribacillus deserti TaxID=673318 RepID=A0ABS2QN89_9BACI|nr:M23 family metallopeptidase [Peribacillus deserti]MBM7694627.1 peptidoglycan hydrolase CwlO-like protein [Peribacillus deserti]